MKKRTKIIIVIACIIFIGVAALIFRAVFPTKSFVVIGPAIYTFENGKAVYLEEYDERTHLLENRGAINKYAEPEGVWEQHTPYSEFMMYVTYKDGKKHGVATLRDKTTGYNWANLLFQNNVLKSGKCLDSKTGKPYYELTQADIDAVNIDPLNLPCDK